MMVTRVFCLLTVDSLQSSFREERGMGALAHARLPGSDLPFCLTACQLFHLALLRSTRVIAGLLRLFRFDFLAGGSLGFLAFVLSQLLRVCHQCVITPCELVWDR